MKEPPVALAGTRAWLVTGEMERFVLALTSEDIDGLQVVRVALPQGDCCRLLMSVVSTSLSSGGSFEYNLQSCLHQRK